jgi:hypothetical protein
VRVEGVTQVDPDGAGPLPARRLTLTEMDATVDPTVSTQSSAARSELLVILLNVVSGRLSLNLVVDAQGTTLAQQIRILAALINSGQVASARKAHDVALRINSGPAAELQRRDGRNHRARNRLRRLGRARVGHADPLHDLAGRGRAGHARPLRRLGSSMSRRSTKARRRPARRRSAGRAGGRAPGHVLRPPDRADGAHGVKVVVQ